MVIRKRDLKIRSRMARSVVEKSPIAVSEPVHVLRKRGSGKSFLGIGLAVVILLLLGWFGTKLALSGWQVSKDNFFKDLFTFGTTTLVGEDKDRVNLVMLGIPGEGNDGPDLTDTLIVASLSTKPEGTNFLFSIPRDLYVRVAGYGNTKINTVYEVGNNRDDRNGGKLTSQIAGEVLGLDIPYYLKIDFAGFEKLIDKLGGVTITVDKNLYDDKYPTSKGEYQVVDIKTGTYTMDGVTALKYARSRQSTSDFDRARRQQQVIIAVRAKAAEMDWLNNPAKALTVMDILADHFATNMKLSEMKRFITLFKEIDLSKIITKVFDDSPAGLLYGTKVEEIYVLRPVGDDFKIISDYVTKAISGEAKIDELDQQAVKEPLKIEVLNGTNIAGLAKKVAAKLEKDGYKVVTTGNNAVKGFTKTMVYDLSNGEKNWQVRGLAGALKADLATDKITSTTGASARVVLGSDAAAN